MPWQLHLRGPGESFKIRWKSRKWVHEECEWLGGSHATRTRRVPGGPSRLPFSAIAVFHHCLEIVQEIGRLPGECRLEVFLQMTWTGVLSVKEAGFMCVFCGIHVVLICYYDETYRCYLPETFNIQV